MTAQSKNTSHYVPNLSRGARVRLVGDHPKKGQECTITGALPNPSHLAMNQWYDVRFDDFSFGRFVESYLERIPGKQEPEAA